MGGEGGDGPAGVVEEGVGWGGVWKVGEVVGGGGWGAGRAGTERRRLGYGLV
jgi:hypothetical protein